MRKVWDIHGGIHPAENKTQSSEQAIIAAGIPEQLVFPLSQHIGAPAIAVVEIGQRVKVAVDIYYRNYPQPRPYTVVEEHLPAGMMLVTGSSVPIEIH